MLSSVSSTSPIPTALNAVSLSAQVREARRVLFEPTANTADPTYVKARYNAWVQFFLGDTAACRVGLEEIANVLKDQLNAVLSFVSSKKTYDFPLDVATILDENKLPEANVCKKGNEAYKFYVTKIVSELNDLHKILASAKENLSELQTLIRADDFENPSVHELLARLRTLETDGEAVKKTFSEYMIPKNLDIAYYDYYVCNGKKEQKQTARTNKSIASGSEAYTMPEHAEIEWDKEKDWKKNDKITFPSKIPDTVSSVEDLRTVKTKKQTGSRTVTTYFFKKGSLTELADRYDTLADTYCLAEDDVKTEDSELSFFGELPLLDKLKYIVFYYTKSGARRIFPDDPDDKGIGFPCLSNPVPTGTNPATGQDRKYTDDVNEIAHLEPFYIGFLVDRDGPVNALASFMEIKSAAILDQIKLIGYRVKALRRYLHLINRGLEEVNKSQSNGNARIPNSAYEILTMVGSNPTRCLKTLNGKDYFVLQWNGNDGSSAYHTTKTNCYLLVPADDEGIDAFIKYADYPAVDYCYEHLFDPTQGIFTGTTYHVAERLMALGFMTRDEWNEHYEKKNQYLIVDYLYYEKDKENAGKFRWHIQYRWTFDGKTLSCKNASKPLPEDCPLLLLEESDESKLPRELETNRMNITAALKTFTENMSWNNYNSGSKWASKLWPGVVQNFTTVCDTVVGNVQTQLESVNKSIESLRNKISTFDTSAVNFRNKAYAIYNKTVNNIE